MDDWMSSDGYFDRNVALTYDRDHGATSPEEIALTASVLEDLADGGRVLEFAVGTGRIALPLARRGVDVSGLELSRAMVDVLRAKDGGEELDVHIGDMTTAKVGGHFSLVFLVFNTIDNLTTQDAQIACFQNAADHLEPGGRFLVETLVPPVQKIPFGETARAFDISDTHIGADKVDIATQRYSSHHVWLDGDTPRHLSIPFRYAWPAELDLMARLAGMDLEHRWGGWNGDAFSNTSTRHISVWRKPGTL